MRWWASAIVVAIAVACSSPARPSASGAKRQAKPRACATIAPTCDSAIDDTAAIAIVHRRCFGCHDAGGIANHDFTSPAALHRAPIAQMVGTCQMPPDGEPPLAEADRRALVAWSACAR